MTLIKSISGIRGTIGGQAGSSLTPIDIVKFTSAFCQLLKRETNKEKLKIVVGRDARISGQMVSSLVCNTLVAYGAYSNGIFVASGIILTLRCLQPQRQKWQLSSKKQTEVS